MLSLYSRRMTCAWYALTEVKHGNAETQLTGKALTRGELKRMAPESSDASHGDLPRATLVKSSEGVHLVRNGRAFLVSTGHVLKLGDQVVVPDGGCAQAVFQEQGGQFMLGTFESGTHASLVYFSRKNGACSVVFDVHRGRVDLSLSSQDQGMDGVNPNRRVLGFHCYFKPLTNF